MSSSKVMKTQKSRSLLVLLMAVRIAFASDFLTDLQDYSTAFALVGLTLTGFYSAYKHMAATDPLSRKDAWETFIYALVGAIIILTAPALSQVLP